MNQSQSIASRVPLVFLQYWWIIVLAAVLGAASALGYSATKTPIYHSKASIYFTMRSATSGTDINQGLAYTQNQMLSFARLATSASVLDGVVDDLATDGEQATLGDLRRSVSVSIPQNTVILDITAASANRDRAAAVVNAVAENLTDAVYRIAPSNDQGVSTVSARVIEPGSPARFQSSPDKAQDTVLGGIAGALAAALGLTLWALLDRRVRSVSALGQVTDMPVLGVVPYNRGGWRVPSFVKSPNGATAEAYRQVRSALRFAAVEHRIGILAVTSSTAGEGKTTASVNLALSFVEMGRRVLIVDADLRRPNVAATLGLEGAVGLSSLLVRSAEMDDVILETTMGLDVLAAGEKAPNPAQLLASDRMKELMDELRPYYDLVVVDTAPLLSVADAAIIAQYVDTTIVLVNSRRTTRAQLERCLSALRGVGADVAGLVLNNVRQQKKDSYRYTEEP